MAYPIIRSVGSGADVSNTTSHTFTMPPITVLGDFFLAFFSCDGTPSISIDAGYSSVGWTLSAIATNTSLSAGYLYGDSFGPSTVLRLTTDSSEQMSWHVYSITDLHNVRNFQGPTTGDSTNMDPPTMAWDDHDHLIIVAGLADGNVVATAAPTDFTELITSIGSSSADGTGCSSAYRYYHPIAPYNPDVFTSVTEQWITYTFNAYGEPNGVRVEIYGGDSAKIGTGFRTIGII